jgi:hypothetical protein
MFDNGYCIKLFELLNNKLYISTILNPLLDYNTGVAQYNNTKNLNMLTYNDTTKTFTYTDSLSYIQCYSDLLFLDDCIITSIDGIRTKSYSLQQDLNISGITYTSGLIYNNYEFIERFKGLIKSKERLHKSNLFSIQITDSKLNESITDETQRNNIQKSINNVIKEVIKKVTPAYTQLWKIIWKGE